MRVSVVATGIDAAAMRESGQGPRPQIITERRRPIAFPATPLPVQTAARSIEIPQPATQVEAAYDEPDIAPTLDPESDPAYLQTEETVSYQQQPTPQPVQPTQGTRVDGSFIAPRPVTSGQVSTGPRPAPATSPSRAPAQAPASEHKKQGLFERMLGPRQAEQQPAPAAQPKPQRQAQVSTRQSAQADLGIDSPSRQSASKAEEEMLDIPAFLRRQAN